MAKINIARLTRDISLLRRELLERVPPHFSVKDLIRSFIGALIIGMTFTFKGLLVEISVLLTTFHLTAIVLAGVFILTLEIYFIGYARVRVKRKRKFGQFWLKRILTFYSVTVIVVLFLIFIYGLDRIVGSENVFNLIIALSFPCAIGASLADLLKQY